MHKINNKVNSEDNIEFIKNKLNPDREMYLLYSKDENPKWNYQENLILIGEGHHLS
jgi:hypothetical protein